MSRADTITKLPLATWAKIFGMHPLHFEQVYLPSQATPHCEQVYFQHEWQTADHVSREEIARAIAEAESKLEKALGFKLAPDWEADEWRPTERPFQAPGTMHNIYDVRGHKQTVQAEWGYFISGGIRSKELINDDVAIVYTDPDGDGYFQVATVTVATTVVDINEIAIYYPGHEGDDRWQIRPIEVSISGGTATITFRRELVVIEDLLEVLDSEGAGADGTDDDNFLSEVDVYRVYNDPQTQASFLWEPLAYFCGSCGGSGCGACAYSIQSGCLIVRGDPRNSNLGYSPGSWDVDTDTFQAGSWNVGRQPDIVRLYYYSGYRNKNQRYISRMDPQWERTVAYMAAALLDRPPCDCAKGDWNMWRQDMLLTAGDEDGKPYYREPGSGLAFANSRGITANPFGSRRGEVNAWHQVQRWQRLTSV